MLLKYFYDERLAQASYLVGCAATGEALVVDPMRDITPYLEMAQREGLRITHVTETHIHADFVSGSRELAAATGSMLYLSDMGNADWKYAYAHQSNVILVRDGDMFKVGNIRIDVIHTPGHTPEHIAFMFTDTAAADKPMGVFTGDFLFVGDVGRPDLLEEAAGVLGTKEPGARQQFATVQKFKSLPDYLQILPGHGAGSACGKALGAIPSTTLGYEKLFNPAFQFEDEDRFVDWLLDGQPEPPRYFAQMKKVNKQGPVLLRELPMPQALDQSALKQVLDQQALVIDLRPREQYAHAHLPGTISVPMTDRGFSTYVGWFVDFERPLYFIPPALSDVPPIIIALQAIGVDHIPGFFDPQIVAEGTAQMPLMSAQQLAERLPKNGLIVLDVRGKTEYAEGHIRGAKHVALGFLPHHLNDLPKDRLIVTQCASGYRSHIAASWLRAHGFENVVNLTSAKEVWAQVLTTDVE